MDYAQHGVTNRTPSIMAGDRPARAALLPGGMAMAVSMALHAAMLPLLLGIGRPTAPIEPAAEQIIEISVAWAPPPAGPQAIHHEEPAPDIQRPTTAAIGTPAAPRHRSAKPRAVTAIAPQPDTGSVDPAPAETPTPQVAALSAATTPPPPRAEMMALYARRLLERLERHKTYPALSERRGEEGIVTLRLIVAADGALVAATPVGEAPRRLIEASLAAVQAAAPFPALPQDFAAAQVAFDLPIAYRLR
jgi:protein TonB